MNRPGRPGFRRRLDTLALRAQARLDADWADHTLPWLMAAALFVVLFAMTLAVVRQLDGGPGLAQWSQAAWHVRRGDPPISSLTGTNLVEEQWSFVALPVLWLSRWIPTPQLLGGIQALALSLAVIPLWRLARNVFDLRLGTTAAVIAAFALAPAVHAANLSMFHPEILAVPALASAALWLRQKRWLLYWAAVAVILCCRADLGLTVAGLGVVAILDGDLRAGVASVVIGLGWTTAAVIVLDPQLPSETLTAAQAFAASGTAPLAEARNLLINPTTVLGDLFAQNSLPIIVALFAPLLFLSLSGVRSLIPAVPPSSSASRPARRCGRRPSRGARGLLRRRHGGGRGGADHHRRPGGHQPDRSTQHHPDQRGPPDRRLHRVRVARPVRAERAELAVPAAVGVGWATRWTRPASSPWRTSVPSSRSR